MEQIYEKKLDILMNDIDNMHAKCSDENLSEEIREFWSRTLLYMLETNKELFVTRKKHIENVKAKLEKITTKNQ